MKMFRENLIENLPDMYKKDKDSNIDKVMQLIQYDIDKFRATLQEIDDSKDLEKATGYTLNLYGEMAGQRRGKASDAQYLLMIKAKNARNRCYGDYQSVVNCICEILGCEKSEVFIKNGDKPLSVILDKVNLSTILEADFTPNQFTKIVQSMLPAGIILGESEYAGTFEFSDLEDEYDETAGFCDVEGGTLGGHFGVMSSDVNDTELPI